MLETLTQFINFYKKVRHFENIFIMSVTYVLTVKNDEKELDWILLDYPIHSMHNRFIKELNYTYLKHEALWRNDGCWNGFKWNTVDDDNNNVFAFTRYSKNEEILVISNFSSQYLKEYKIGVDEEKNYRILLNSDSKKYGGNGFVNGNIHSKVDGINGFKYHTEVNIAPFSTMYLIEK